MESRQDPEPEAGIEAEFEPETEPAGDQPFGSTKGEAISLVLFALMVIIASACFVIW